MTSFTPRRNRCLVNQKGQSNRVQKRLKTSWARLASRSRLQRCSNPATFASRCLHRLAKLFISRCSYRMLLSHSQVISLHDLVVFNLRLKGRAAGTSLEVVPEGVAPAGTFAVGQTESHVCARRKSALKRSSVFEESVVTGKRPRNGWTWLWGGTTEHFPRRVRFINGLVTGVVEIESHRSFTLEERLTTFSSNIMILAMARRNYIEDAWEGLLGRVVEEDEFDVDAYGRRWHPAHWTLGSLLGQ